VRDANDWKLVLITGVGPVPVGTDAMSAYIRALDEALADRCDGYRAHLEAAPLAAHTRRTYAGYLSWLAELDPLTRRRQGDPFTDGHARDYTVRDYRTHLLTAGRAKPASVNLALAAVDHFYRFIGLGPADTRREQLPQAAPRALDADQTRRLLRAAERTATAPGGIRDRAIVTLLLFTGLRIAAARASATGRSRSTPRPEPSSIPGSSPGANCPVPTGPHCSCH